MRPRQTLTELFSTFVQFEADHFSHWGVDSKLQRNIQRCLQQSPDAPTSELFWSLYWYKSWQRALPGLAGLHLSAYLQEPCYWAAQQAIKKFTSVHYALPDYFQIAIAETNTLLKDFKPEKGASLKTYAAIAFPSLLRDKLRQRHEADICTNWTLLRKISKKRLLEALQQTGLPSTTVAQYRLAWTCFKALYVPAALGAKLPQLDQALWDAIATLYNQERKNQLPLPGPECTPETIEQWLTRCAESVRAYLYPPVQSLNAVKPGAEAGELQDDLPDPGSEPFLSELIAEEEAQIRQAQRSKIAHLLKATLEAFDPQSQELLQLYYGEGWSQQQIMQQLGMSQASVSRRLTRAREQLLAALVQWSRETLNSTPASNLIKDMSVALEEWLTVGMRGKTG